MKLKDYFYDKVTLVTITDCDGCPFGYIAKYGREEKNMIKSYVCEFDLDKKIIYKPTKECPVKNTGVFVEFYEEKCGKST